MKLSVGTLGSHLLKLRALTVEGFSIEAAAQQVWEDWPRLLGKEGAFMDSMPHHWMHRIHSG